MRQRRCSKQYVDLLELLIGRRENRERGCKHSPRAFPSLSLLHASTFQLFA